MKYSSVLALSAFALSGCFVGPAQPVSYQPTNYNEPPPENTNTSPDYTPPSDYVGAGGSGTSGIKNPRYPRVMIEIPEFHINRNNLISNPSAQTEFLKTFKLAGYKLIDKKQAEKVWKDDVLFTLEKEGDVQAAAALAFKIGADVLVLGEAISEKGIQTNTSYGGVPGKIVTANASVRIKVIRAATGEILWADSEEGRGADSTQLIAGKKALSKAGKELSSRVADIILKQWNQGDAGFGATAVEVIVSVPAGKLTLAQLKEFKQGSMRSVSGLQEIVQREFAEGAAILEFVYEGDAQGLAETIDGKRIGSKTCTVIKVNNGKIFVNLK